MIIININYLRDPKLSRNAVFPFIRDFSKVVNSRVRYENRSSAQPAGRILGDPPTPVYVLLLDCFT